MRRRTSTLGAVLAISTLVAGQLGAPAAVLAAAPVAVDDSGIVVQKNASATTISVLANDTVDPADTITAVSAPGHGTAAIAVNGRSVTYAPTTGYTGLDSFTYTVSNDPDGDDTATVSLRVNAPPVALDDPSAPSCGFGGAYGDSFPIREDFGQFVLGGSCGPNANDSDPDGTITSWQVDQTTAHGDLDWNAAVPGFVGYTADPDFSTPEGDWVSDSFTYHMVDNNGASSNQATYRLWIAPINDPPTVTAGPFVTSPEDTAYSQPWATNISPGPANESSQTVHFEMVQTLQVSNPQLLFSAAPAISPDGTLTFTPALNSTGFVRLSFVAKDDGGLVKWDNNRGTGPDPDDTSDPFVVDITVTGVNDPPVAGTDSITVAEDSGTSYAINVLANDTDADHDSLTVTATTNGALGTASIFDEGMGAYYTPNPDANGADSFTYTASDGHGGSAIGTVNVTITPVQDAPAAADDTKTLDEDAGITAIDVLANDSDADDDPLTITDAGPGTMGTVAITGGGSGLTYTPNTNATGSDSFTYTISDGNGGTDTATVDVTITPVDDAPVAMPDAVTVIEDQTTASTVPVLANDTDVESDTIHVTANTNGAKGVVTIAGDGLSVAYKPNANAFGSDSFTYTADDGNGGSAIATVTVTITAVNDPPNAVNDGVPTPFKVYLKAGAKAIPVLANDTSLPDGPETLRVIAVTQGKHGIVTITGAGTGLTYNPTGTTGIDVFTYTITDGHGKTDRATVQVMVARDLTLPKATITGLTKSTITGSTKLRLTLTWTLTDTGSGLRSQLLQRRTDSGSWVTVTLPSSSTRTAAFAMSRGHTYTFRIRGTDRSGNVGLFVYRSIRI